MSERNRDNVTELTDKVRNLQGQIFWLHIVCLLTMVGFLGCRFVNYDNDGGLR